MQAGRTSSATPLYPNDTVPTGQPVLSYCMATPEGQPKVFISYSWGNNETVQRVNEVADYLEENGIFVEMDRYLEPGANLYAFMEKMVNDPTIDKVFCFCDLSYTQKVLAGTGGVGTEAAIITPDVYEQVKGNRDQERHRFVAVAMDTDDQGDFTVPAMFRSLLVVPMVDPTRDTEVWEELARVAAGRPRRERRTGATLPVHLRADAPHAHTFGTAGKATTARLEARNQGSRRGIAAFREYLRVLLAAVTALDPEGLDARSRVEQVLDANGPVFQEFAEVVDAAADFIEAPLDETLGAFFQDLITHNFSFDFTKAQRDFSRILTKEVLVLAVAALIRHRRFHEVSNLLSRGYWEGERDREPERYRLMTHPPEDLYDNAWVTATRRRCRELSGVSATEYVQADAVLYLRGAFHSQYLWDTDLVEDWMRLPALPLARDVTTRARAEPLEILMDQNLPAMVDQLERVATTSSVGVRHPLRLSTGIRGTLPFLLNAQQLRKVIDSSS